MDPLWLPKIMIDWKPEGRKKRGLPRRTWEDVIYTAMSERDLRMGEWNDQSNGICKSEGVARRFKATHTHTHTHTHTDIYIY
jgi:hypothetical protein